MTTAMDIFEADDREYDRWIERVQARFLPLSNGPLFATDTDGLFAAYLAAFHEERRQYHNCNACRRFIEAYGGLVKIEEDGRQRPVMWNPMEAPDEYSESISALARIVEKAKITGVFYYNERLWGVPANPKGAKHGGVGEWHHFAVKPDPKTLHRSIAQTPGQAMAEKREDRGTVLRALAEFTRDQLATAVKILSADALYRSEKVLGAAEWLHKLQDSRASAKDKAERENLTWLAVATAPAGFCHPRSSMIGTLLEDIAAGLPLDEISRKFAAKMHPLRYQRPQALPSAGNIQQAEELVAKLGIAASLRRRYARLDEIKALWRPALAEEAPAAGGVFAHLKPKG